MKPSDNPTAELRKNWRKFCENDYPTPRGFIERMEASGLARLHNVNGRKKWDLAAKGRRAVGPSPVEYVRMAKARHGATL